MNPLLTSLVDDVYTLTNRPDLVGETKLAVRNATLAAHSTDFYYKDLVETGVQFDFPDTQHSLDYKLLIPRWRALKYVRVYDYYNPTGYPNQILEILTPESVLDTYKINKENICYAAGRELQIRTRAMHQHILLGAYLHPDVTPDNYDSWIAEEQSAAIVYKAASVVFKTIGYDEQVSQYNGLVAEEYNLLRMSNIQANGY